MESLSKLNRRCWMKWGAISAGLAPFVSRARAQDAGSEAGRLGVVGGRAEEELYPGKGLPGGGQLEIRLSATVYTSDADQLEVAQRLKPFNLASWVEEWTRVAERNEKLAEKFASEGFKVTANDYYSRASNFYREACWPMPVTAPRMLPLYKKMRETFDKAWQQTKPPFERVQVNYEGQLLDGYFRKPNGPAGKKFPTLIAFQGADTMAEATILNGGAYISRGMAYLALDFPGQGGALRLKDLHLPPDTERIAKAMIDYLVTRPDVDANRIGMQGISMGGYGTPRAASGEPRIAAALMSSGSSDLGRDLFDYYPPIQERVRWIIGARDLADARKKLAEYTLEGRANRIECPMLIGYSQDDRIMDPQGAFRLYQMASNSKREMVEGTGHAQASNAGGPRAMRPPALADWTAKHLVSEG
ncbi:MAG: alpha/beta hydrolase family protein [Bryobacteraceae bacterium]